MSVCLRKLRFAGAVLLLAASPVLAQGWDGDGGPAWSTLLGKARQEATLVLHGCAEVAPPLAKAFKADTGIDVAVISGDPNRFRVEAQSGRSSIDVRLGGAQDLDLAKQGLLSPVKDVLVLPEVTDPAKWRRDGISWADDTKTFMPIGSSYVTARPLVNRSALGFDIASAQDLLRPELKGKMAAYDPASGAGQVVAAYYAFLFGREFAEKLYKGQQVVISSDYRQLAEWAARGLYPVVFGVDPVTVQRFRAAGVTTLAFVSLSDAPGGLNGGCSLVALPKAPPHPSAAAVFVNWYLSRRGQAALVEATQLPTLRRDVDLASVPADLIPSDDEAYVDTAKEEWYLIRRPEMRQLLGPLFGR